MVGNYIVNDEGIKQQNNKHSEKIYIVKRQYNKRTIWSRKFMIKKGHDEKIKQLEEITQ